jgi:hypothetical protein
MLLASRLFESLTRVRRQTRRVHDRPRAIGPEPLAASRLVQLDARNRRKSSRGDSLCTLVNETVGSRLLLAVFPQTFTFQGDAVLKLVKPGLYRKRKT